MSEKNCTACAGAFTVLEPVRPSVWLLARILNLSVQASRSSFTPTTGWAIIREISEQRFARKTPQLRLRRRRRRYFPHLSPAAGAGFAVSPAGLMVFPPTVISTAVLTRTPMVSFSGFNSSSLALRGKTNRKWGKVARLEMKSLHVRPGGRKSERVTHPFDKALGKCSPCCRGCAGSSWRWRARGLPPRIPQPWGLRATTRDWIKWHRGRGGEPSP